mmetsp:Transcript_15037/g.25556  ORF Transcript_15037/g.25556 Transcript_15037/m.25556 type:complete len:139 (+) Transcript_15037:204-620(+)
MTKVSTNSGADSIDLCFIRTLINFLVSFFNVWYNNKNVIKEVKPELRKPLVIRSLAGLVGFTLMVISLKFIPIYQSSIIFNTAPFWTAILGYLILGTTLSTQDLFLMAGCFFGVVLLAIGKNQSSQMEQGETSSALDN